MRALFTTSTPSSLLYGSVNLEIIVGAAHENGKERRSASARTHTPCEEPFLSFQFDTEAQAHVPLTPHPSHRHRARGERLQVPRASSAGGEQRAGRKVSCSKLDVDGGRGATSSHCLLLFFVGRGKWRESSCCLTQRALRTRDVTMRLQAPRRAGARLSPEGCIVE